MKKFIFALLIFCGLFTGALNAMDDQRNGCLQKTPQPTHEPKNYEYTKQDSSSSTTTPCSNSNSNTSDSQKRSNVRAHLIMKHLPEIFDK